MERSGMEWKACREQHPGGMGDGVPHYGFGNQFFIYAINR